MSFIRTGARTGLAAGALALTAGLASPAFAQGTASITFAHPETYRDGNLSWGPVDQRLTFQGIERIVQRIARQRLPAGYEIDITVLELDLAGMINPLRSRSGELRVMRGDTWPSITFTYALRRGAKTVARGQETLRSMNYLMDPAAVRSGDPLAFEKAMIDRWFRTRFAGLPATRPAS